MENLAHVEKAFTRWYAYQPFNLTATFESSQTMSSTPNASKPEENASKVPEKPKPEDAPHLGVLEEDDEFEEFECAGGDKSHHVQAETTDADM